MENIKVYLNNETEYFELDPYTGSLAKAPKEYSEQAAKELHELQEQIRLKRFIIDKQKEQASECADCLFSALVIVWFVLYVFLALANEMKIISLNPITFIAIMIAFFAIYIVYKIIVSHRMDKHEN